MVYDEVRDRAHRARGVRGRAAAAPRRDPRPQGQRARGVAALGAGGRGGGASEFPDVTLRHQLVDSMAMLLLQGAGRLRRDRHREPVRRHPLGRGRDDHGLARHAAVGEPRRGRHRALRAGARLGARHRGPRRRESARRDPVGGDAARALARARRTAAASVRRAVAAVLDAGHRTATWRARARPRARLPRDGRSGGGGAWSRALEPGAARSASSARPARSAARCCRLLDAPRRCRSRSLLPIATRRARSGESVEFRGETLRGATRGASSRGLDLLICCAPPEAALELGARRRCAREVPCIDCSGALALSPRGAAARGRARRRSARADAPLLAAPPGAALALALRAGADPARAAGSRRVVATMLESCVGGRARRRSRRSVPSRIALFNQQEPADDERRRARWRSTACPRSARSRRTAARALETRSRAVLARLLGAPDAASPPRSRRSRSSSAQASRSPLETERPLDPKQARELLVEAPGVELWTRDAEGPNLRAAAGARACWSGRLRRRPDRASAALLLWLAADPLRLAAANARARSRSAPRPHALARVAAVPPRARVRRRGLRGLAGAAAAAATVQGALETALARVAGSACAWSAPGAPTRACTRKGRWRACAIETALGAERLRLRAERRAAAPTSRCVDAAARARGLPRAPRRARASATATRSGTAPTRSPLRGAARLVPAAPARPRGDALRRGRAGRDPRLRRASRRAGSDVTTTVRTLARLEVPARAGGDDRARLRGLAASCATWCAT